MTILKLTEKEFNDLPEYSCSIPTGTTPGKRWKRNCNAFKSGAEPDWVICEYSLDQKLPEGSIAIKYYRPKLMNQNEELIRQRLFGD